MLKKVINYLFLLMIAGSVFAGTTGKIVGTVTQQRDGEPLVGVNVAILELGMGAATDADGYFFITNVPPGSYTLQISYIGYQTVEYRNVNVSVDQTTEVRVPMQETTVQLENAITVVAERPLIQKDITSKRSVIDGSQIADKLPVSTLNEVLAIQSGVTRDEDGGIHIRGGRLGEVTYLVDGTYVRNPFDNSLGGNVDVEAIQEMEVISGTFNAEYGNALSGVVNIVTKEGSPEYKFKLQYESAQLNSSPYHQADWQLQLDDVKSLTPDQQSDFRDLVRSNGESAYRDFDLFDNSITGNIVGVDVAGKLNASVSGPVPGSGNNAHFFVAGTFRNEESPLPYGFELDRVLSSKLTVNILPTLKFQLNADWSTLWYQDYNHQYKYWQFFANSEPEIGSYPISRDLKTRFTGKITHTLSKSTFYNVSLSRIYNAERNYVPGRSVVTDPNTGELISSDYLTRGFYQGLDGSFQIGDVRYWRNTHSTTLDFDVDVISQMNRYNQVKTGIELRQHTIFRHRVGMPPREQLEFFEQKPVEFAAYLQDKIELSFLIVNLGLRFDMFDAKDTYFSDPGKILQTVTNSNGETSIITVPEENVPVRYKFSPRIGLAHPISATTVFHFAYGQFFQIPRYYDLYRNNGLDDLLANDPLIGNPGLEPEETTAFEAGIKQQLGADYALEVTAYYKDIDNLISSFYYFSGRDYTVFVNADYGRVQGVDVTLNKRYSNYFAGSLNYTLMIAQGNESDPLEGYTLYREDDAFLRPNRNFPLDFDRRHSFNVNLDIGLPRDFGPELGGFHPLGNLTANFLLRAASGLPYTPSSRNPDATIVPERNSARKPWVNQVDLRLNKRFNLFDADIDWYLRVENIFDHINVLRVWTQTGDPWDAGDTSIQSNDRQANPENVDIRRTVRTSIVFRF